MVFPSLVALTPEMLCAPKCVTCRGPSRSSPESLSTRNSHSSASCDLRVYSTRPPGRVDVTIKAKSSAFTSSCLLPSRTSTLTNAHCKGGSDLDGSSKTTCHGSTQVPEIRGRYLKDARLLELAPVFASATRYST